MATKNMRQTGLSYSIGYTLCDPLPGAGLLKSVEHTCIIQQTAYRSVTLNPNPARSVAPPEAKIVPRFDDDFFETAFEGLTEIAALNQPAGDLASVPAPGLLRGYLEDCSPNRIAGWAHDPGPGRSPVQVAIMLGRIVLAELLADDWRADLHAASIGTGCHGFEFRPVPPVARDLLGAVKVVRVADKAELPRVFDLVNQ